MQRLRELVEEGNEYAVAFVKTLLCVVKGVLDDVVGIARPIDVDDAAAIDEDAASDNDDDEYAATLDEYAAMLDEEAAKLDEAADDADDEAAITLDE